MSLEKEWRCCGKSQLICSGSHTTTMSSPIGVFIYSRFLHALKLMCTEIVTLSLWVKRDKNECCSAA